jgi:preprotein translocase SecE subunit
MTQKSAPDPHGKDRDKSKGQAAMAPPTRGALLKPKGFIGESIDELKKVHTPTRQETIQATLVTLAILLAFAIVLAGLDWIFRGLMWRLV